MAAEGLKERLTDGYLRPWLVKARQAIATLDATVRPAGSRWSALVNLGMKPIDALKAGTSHTGSPEVGKFADIVSCPGNPEENIRQVEKIHFVMKEGVVYRKPEE